MISGLRIPLCSNPISYAQIWFPEISKKMSRVQYLGQDLQAGAPSKFSSDPSIFGWVIGIEPAL